MQYDLLLEKENVPKKKNVFYTFINSTRKKIRCVCQADICSVTDLAKFFHFL